jgi:hypothetical protein
VDHRTGPEQYAAIGHRNFILEVAGAKTMPRLGVPGSGFLQGTVCSIVCCELDLKGRKGRLPVSVEAELGALQTHLVDEQPIVLCEVYATAGVMLICSRAR